MTVYITGGELSEYDPHRGIVRHSSQLHRRGPLPQRQPVPRPLLLRLQVPTRAARTEVHRSEHVINPCHAETGIILIY